MLIQLFGVGPLGFGRGNNMVLNANYDYVCSPLVAAFPAGFQPGVSHTKLSLTFSQGTNPQTGLVDVQLNDSLHNIVGANNGVVLGLTTSVVVTLVDTGDPFNAAYQLYVSMPFGIGIGDSITFSKIEFS